MKTVTRADLAEAARAAAVDFVSADNAARLVDQALDFMADALVAGDTVKIHTFGSFVAHRAPARTGRNPKRPDELHAIPAHRRVLFRASPELRHRVTTGRRG